YERRVPGAAPIHAFDPREWGDMLVLEIDAERSGLRLRAPAAYLFGRAVRAKLLACFAERGLPGDAPDVLTGRVEAPHLAVVPLPHVGGEHGDGGIRGVALLFPHITRMPDVADQRRRVEEGLLKL